MKLINQANFEVPANVRSEYDTWEEGFQAYTDVETFGMPVPCPYYGRQAGLWRGGYAASKRVSELKKEL